MKTIICKPLWSLSILLIILTPVFGQTYISNGSDVCLSTISRNPTGSYPVHYMKTGPYSGKILFNFNNMLGPYSFSSLPISGYDIKDITVVGNTIFFCGKDTVDNGIYGICKKGPGINPPYMFRIYKLYDINVEYITDVQRIRVFCYGTDTNVLLVGTYLNKVQPFTRNVVIHVKNNSTCTVAYSSVEHFDDIEILDDYVVVSARKGDGIHKWEPHYMRVLNKNGFTFNDTLFDYYYGWDRSESSGRILLQRTEGNGLVSVYFRGIVYYINPYTVNSNGILQLTSYKKIEPPAIFKNVKDVAYDSSSHTLTIIHNSDTIGYASQFDCSYFPTVSYITSYNADFNNLGYKDTLFSVGPKSSNDFYVTGIKNNKMALWFMPNGCEYPTQCPTGDFQTTISRVLGPTTKTTVGVHQISFQLSTVGLQMGDGCYVVTPYPVLKDDNE